VRWGVEAAASEPSRPKTEPSPTPRCKEADLDDWSFFRIVAGCLSVSLKYYARQPSPQYPTTTGTVGLDISCTLESDSFSGLAENLSVLLHFAHLVICCSMISFPLIPDELLLMKADLHSPNEIFECSLAPSKFRCQQNPATRKCDEGVFDENAAGPKKAADVPFRFKILSPQDHQLRSRRSRTK